jgi:hypothetical protein
VVFAAGLPGSFALLLDKGQLLFVTKDSLRTINDKKHQANTHQDEPDGRGLNTTDKWQ